MMTHFDPALQLPADFEAQVQMEMNILKGPNVKWVWNTRFIRDSEYLDIRRTACNVLKDLVTGPFAYMVREVSPANFEQKLRQLVVGHVQNTTQQAHKLTCVNHWLQRRFEFGVSSWDAPPPQEQRRHPSLPRDPEGEI
jgi:hypothetical protein